MFSVLLFLRHSPTVIVPCLVAYAIYADYTNTQRFKQRQAEIAKILEGGSSSNNN